MQPSDLESDALPLGHESLNPLMIIKISEIRLIFTLFYYSPQVASGLVNESNVCGCWKSIIGLSILSFHSLNLAKWVLLFESPFLLSSFFFLLSSFFLLSLVCAVMGGVCSVPLSCDPVLNQFSQCLSIRGSYIHNLSDNLASLEEAMGVLRAKRDDVQSWVNREEFNGHHRKLAKVQEWFTSVQTIEDQFNDLFMTHEVELQRLCCCRFCSKNMKISYRYGKSVIRMLRNVESLSSQGEFDVVTEVVPLAAVEEWPIDQDGIVGQETLLEKVWNRLMEVGIVGLYGMGGVGKTTLLKKVNNKFGEIGGVFSIVIWVVVSKNATVRNIQGDIGKKLGLEGKEWDEKNENERSIDIHKILKKKKFVLFLDDMWEKVSLNEIGVPNPNSENGCKVAFTTRSREVCGRMKVDNPIEVCCLDTDKAWDLFKKVVGENTLNNHTDIPKLAKEVVRKCCGLPLALNVIGETMAYKNTVREWHQAIQVLASNAAEFSGMDKILPILKYSYDSLKGEQVKSCFLYCCLFPEDREIDKSDLIDYWVGEGFIDEKEGQDWAQNRGYEILNTLVRACLLEGVESDERVVKMHDVVREMAIWISSDLGKDNERCIVQAGVRLREMPKVKNWKNVRRMSLMENDIEKISESAECPELTTLILRENRELTTISGKFFRSMPRLLVLDFKANTSLRELPEQISELASLRYLDLSHTLEMKQLPVGFQKLKMLIHLDLRYTKQLESLHGISELSSLRTLRLAESKVWLDKSMMKELFLLENLEYISINVSTSLVGELLYDPRVERWRQIIFVKERREELVRVFVLPATSNLRYVSIENCGMSEIKIEKTPWNKSLTSPCFSNLSAVRIDKCNGLKDLTWLLFAPNLTRLSLLFLEQLEDIISRKKAESELVNEIIPFQKLESFYFWQLPQLKSIYWSPLSFPCLKSIFTDGDCQKLRKLPLDSKSVFKVEEFEIIYNDEEWIQRIEWEDEDTRSRFLPSCSKLGSKPLRF